jgi:oligoendopeptidase F
MPVFADLDSYSLAAERFVSALDREYYLHYAGHKQAFEIEAIYDRHSALFERGAVEWLRERFLAAADGDDRRRSRYLLQLAVEGFMGQATKAQASALAERESKLEVEVDGQAISFRQAVIAQANETDPERRAAIEDARLGLLESDLNPLYLEILESSHALAVELGWKSYREMQKELKGFDLGELERQTRAFSEATAGYRELVEPQLVAQTGIGFDDLRRSDLPFFYRATAYDSHFPAERLVESFEATLAGLGIDLRAQSNVKLDIETRPNKSPRAFCSPVSVPSEIYLVIAPKGGHDDYSALFHEGGHTEHYASVDPALPFEFRHLGDNSVTEGFAFLLEHLVEDAGWLERVLAASDLDSYPEYVRAIKLLFLRRYAAKLSYELELHAGEKPLREMPALYAKTMGESAGIDWPEATYLADVDDGYYAANYLRAWALEVQLRRHLTDRFGPDWFTRAEAGELLRSAWREGQRLNGDELLAELTGERIDFSVMLGEVGLAQ